MERQTDMVYVMKYSVINMETVPDLTIPGYINLFNKQPSPAGVTTLGPIIF